jgi:hypothetical protein
VSRETWLSLVISIVASIPVGIIAALVTPRVQVWLAERGTKATLVRASRLRREFRETYFYVKHPHALTQMLVIAATRTFLLGSIMTAMIAFIAVVAVLSASIGLSAREVVVVAPVFVVFGMAAAMAEMGRATRAYWRARTYPECAENVPREIQDEVKAEIDAGGSVPPG